MRKMRESIASFIPFQDVPLHTVTLTYKAALYDGDPGGLVPSATIFSLLLPC